MNKWVVWVLLLAGCALAENVKVEVDGRELTQAAPVRSGQRLLLPMRSIFEALGATLDVQGSRILAKRGEDQVEVRIGSSLAMVNGRSVALDEPARLVNGRTMVPLRFVAESLGAKVSYGGGRVAIETGVTLPSVPVTVSGESWGGTYTFEPGRDLKRLRVGNQASILKVLDRSNGHEAAHLGLDDRNGAAYTPSERESVFSSLGVPSSDLPRAAESVMSGYSRLPRREALAFLGAVGSHPGLPSDYRARLQAFVADKLGSEKDVVVRRQALLALALMHGPAPATVERVVSFYEQSENLWETFPVQMFFELHAHEIKSSAQYASVHERVEAVNSLYRENILGYLKR